MAMYGCREVIHGAKEQLKSVTMESGVQSVMINSEMKRLRWCVEQWDTILKVFGVAQIRILHRKHWCNNIIMCYLTCRCPGIFKCIFWSEIWVYNS